MVSATSTKCVALSVPLIYTAPMPFHGAPRSEKTHSLAASRQASSTANPTVRWSQWLTLPPLAPGEAEVHPDYDLRTQASERSGQIPIGVAPRTRPSSRCPLNST